MKRGRAAALAGAGIFVVAVLLVVAVHSMPAGCAYALPAPVLPDALRVQGGFDQAIDPGDVRTLQDVSARAGQSIFTNLLGVQPQAAVTVTSRDPVRPDAVVVALKQSGGTPGSGQRISGVAVFLRDCSGRLHYSSVTDLGNSGPADFPAVSRHDAETALGGDVELTYDTDPARPAWRATHGGAMIPAQ